jgi:hypothetical protein
MSGNEIISILALVISSTCALLIAYWHRKQMRQVEAYRQDPTVGLSPPPSRLWVHLSRNGLLWMILLSITAQVASLVPALRSVAPITRAAITALILNVAGILFNVLLGIVHLVQRDIRRAISSIMNTQAEMVTVMGKQAETDGKLMELTALLEQLTTLRIERATRGKSENAQ